MRAASPDLTACTSQQQKAVYHSPRISELFFEGGGLALLLIGERILQTCILETHQKLQDRQAFTAELWPEGE